MHLTLTKALVKLLQLVRTDLDRERKSRIGLRGLSQSLNTQENQNVTDKLYHVSNQFGITLDRSRLFEQIIFFYTSTLQSVDSIDAHLFGRCTV